MSAAPTVRWKMDGQQRTGVKAPRPRGDPDSQFTRYGTIKSGPVGEVKDPTEGFERHYGATGLAQVRMACWGGVVGERREDATLLRKVQGIDGVWRCGVAYHDGARTVYVSAEVTDRDVSLSRFGSDPAFAAWSDQRKRYSFAPGSDLMTLPLDARLHLTKRWDFIRQKHAAVEAEMDAAMALSPSVATLRPYLDYARRRGLKIVTDTVSLK